ncbi:hypothetical protein [Brucella inopinata]|uniref:hypothetical protein n=1 Tax=Brucella inopinata TaxID=1218315 RepID=UPI000870D9C5|nr:hypothetical protein [Brucella inopinata]SCD23536.1 hypothetical protein BR141012304_11115 [Brucella inopinata]
MMWANIVEKVVVELTDIDPKGRFHESFVWVKCPDNVRQGWQYDGKNFTAPAGEAAPSFASVKEALKVSVDVAAEAERLNYITPGVGQTMTYQQKVVEAQAFKAASNPKAADYPILSSEVGITAETLGEVADIVLAAFAQWQQIGAMIESIRLGAKRDIDAAEDEALARAIVDAIVWPSAQVQA